MKILQHCFRRHVPLPQLDETIAFYEALEGSACERRVAIPETGVVAAKIGQFLVLAGDEAQLAAVRHVQAIFYVDDLGGFAEWAQARGVELLHDPREVTAGRNVTVRHPDGLVVEYFEARR